MTPRICCVTGTGRPGWVVATGILYAVAWPTLFLTHDVPAALGPIVAAFAAWPLLLLRINPLLGWAISAGSAVAIPLFFDLLPTWSYPWQVVHIIELLVLIVAVAWTRPLPVVIKVWLASTVLFFVAMPTNADSGWAFGVTAIVFVIMLVRWLVLSRRQVARLEEVSDLERARRTVLQERTRIARDLHDVVAHHMSMVVVSAQTAPYRHEGVPPGLRPSSRRSLPPVVRRSTKSVDSSGCCAATANCPSSHRRHRSPICPSCSRQPSAPVFP